MNDDFITGLFEKISIEHFLGDSAVSSVPRWADEYFEDYERFLKHQIDLCVSRINDEGFVPLTCLSSDNRQKYFKPDADETAYDYTARLRREAHDMEAVWLFTAMILPARAYNRDDPAPDPIDVDDIDAIRQAIHDGDLTMGVCWYTENSSTGFKKAGLILEGEPVTHVRGQMHDQNDLFTGILDAQQG